MDVRMMVQLLVKLDLGVAPPWWLAGGSSGMLGVGKQTQEYVCTHPVPESGFHTLCKLAAATSGWSCVQVVPVYEFFVPVFVAFKGSG